MMSTREQDQMQREMMVAPALDFKESADTDPWLSVRVEDGAELKAKLVLVGIKRLSDDAVTGEPRYIISSEVKVRITKQPDYKERKEEDGRP